LDQDALWLPHQERALGRGVQDLFDVRKGATFRRGRGAGGGKQGDDDQTVDPPSHGSDRTG
jgi:hypothetical protein